MKLANIFIVILLLTITGASKAQSVSSSLFKFPEVQSNGSGKLYVSSLDNSGSENAEFGPQFAKLVTNRLMSGKQNKYNPWLTSQIYKRASSESDADVVIAGIYNFNTKVAEGNEKVQTMSKDSIPFSYMVYSNTGVAELIGDVVIKSQGAELKKISLGDSKKKSESSTFNKPKDTVDPEELFEKLEEKAIKKVVSTLQASLVPFNYKFERCKTKNKAIKKEYKEKFKGCRKLLQSDNVKQAGAAYQQLNGLEKSEAALFNIGMCYEITGNLSKAEGYYKQCSIKEAKKALKRVEELKKAQEFLKLKGVDVTEYEF